MNKVHYNFVKKFFTPVYEDDAATKAAAEKAAADAAAAEAAKGKGKSFSQDEVNAIVARERSADKERNTQLVQQLESLRSTSQMTEESKKALETRIEELQTQFMTKEEIAARDKKKLETELSAARDSAINEGKLWRTRFEKSMVERSILDEAIKNDSFAPNQIVELLSTKSKVVEATSTDNKPTGKFEVRIAFDDTDKDNKPVTLDFTAADAVKRMKELPERFGNLFKSGVRGGLGGNNLQGADGNLKIESILKNPEEYRKHRKTLKEKGII